MTAITAPLTRDDFALWAEVDPPKGASVDGFLSSARSLVGLGLCPVVTDGAQAVMRMTPLGPARFLVQEGISHVVSLGGRDRNRLSFQGDLLAAWALGIRHVILTQGADLCEGDQPLARSAGDLDLGLMVDVARRLSRGEDLGGAPLHGSCGFAPGVMLSPTGDMTENRRRADEIGRLVDLGAAFVVLGPTYDEEHLTLFAEAAGAAGVPFVGSLLWLRSLALVRYWNRLPGRSAIPEPVVARLMESRRLPHMGMPCAIQMLRVLRQLASGVLFTSPGWEACLPAFLHEAGLLADKDEGRAR